MFTDFINSLILHMSNFVRSGTKESVTDMRFLEKEIARWKNSPQRMMQIKGHLYYRDEHDIIRRKRTMIGADGKLQTVDNLPNNRIIDNQYKKMVNQKANYLVGRPFGIETENDQYHELLMDVFNRKFMKVLKTSAKYAYNGGISWLYPCYDQQGDFTFRVFPGYEILPFWKDSEHTILDFAIRLYLTIGYKGTTPIVIEKVEIYSNDGVRRYVLDGGRLKEDKNSEGVSDTPYITMVDRQGSVKSFNWERIPLIPMKSNEEEIPLIKNVKSLQDGINVMLSDFENNMQEDARNTILVLKNYDGQNLGEFRKNLATFGAVKVRYDGDTKGGVETLEISVNAENYKSIVEIFKKALIENAMGFDAKDDRMSGTPNQMNIQSMYSDIDLDANDMETEYQAAFEEILWFVNVHLVNNGYGDYTGEKVKIIFNRDIMMNEGEAIDNCQKSTGIISNETIIAKHPWVDNSKTEMERLEEEKQKAQEEAISQYAPFQKDEQTKEEKNEDINEE